MDKKNVLKNILRVILIFVIFEVIVNTLGAQVAKISYNTILNGKYTTYFISEAIVLLLAILLVIIRKKTYIFKDNKLSFIDTLKNTLPILILACLSFITNSISITTDLNIPNIISLLFYAISIGLFEEVFYRGIILEELLNNNSSKKEAIMAIIISGVIFGSLHLTNILAGQDVLSTITQFIQATSIGILFGVVYYLSKNVYALAFLHGFYDFSLLLSETSLTTSCAYSDTTPFIVSLSSIIISLILSLIYIVYAIKILKRNNGINTKKYNIIIYILIALVFITNILFGLNGVDSTEYYICTKYEDRTIDKIETHYYNYNDFYYEDNHIYKKGDKVYINGEVENINDVKRVLVVNDKIVIITYESGNYFVYISLIQERDYKKYIVPSLSGIGYLKDVNSDIVYPLLKSSNNDLYIIDDTIYKVIGG